tara:strand:+ start:537 stop:716 length:180 start_codon:yes stop_codon:yes gene_type:complete
METSFRNCVVVFGDSVVGIKINITLSFGQFIVVNILYKKCLALFFIPPSKGFIVTQSKN